MGGSPTSWNQFNSIRMWNGKMRLLSSVDPGTWEEWMILRVTNIHFQWWWRWNWRPGGWGKARQQVDDKCEIIKIFLIITNFLDYYPKSIPEWTFPRLLLSPPSNTRSWYTVVVLMIVISPAAHPAPHPQCQFKVDREICGLYGISCSRDTGISDSLSTIWKGAMPPTLLPICYRLIITEWRRRIDWNYTFHHPQQHSISHPNCFSIKTEKKRVLRQAIVATPENSIN